MTNIENDRFSRQSPQYSGRNLTHRSTIESSAIIRFDLNTIPRRKLSTQRHTLVSGSALTQNEYSVTYQRGTLASILLEVFAIADNASKATDRRSVFGGA